MKPATSSRPSREIAASCSAAIHPSVRSSRARTCSAVSGTLVASSRYVRGLLGGEPQVGGADLDELPAGAPPGDRQVGVGAGADHQVHVRWQVLDEEGHPRGDARVVGEVVVVEHQPHLPWCLRQLVEQRGDHDVGRHGCREQLERPVADARQRAAAGRSRPPSRTWWGRCRWRRARATRRGGHRRGPARATTPAASSCRSPPVPTPASAALAAQPVHEPGAGHQAAAQPRDVQLGRHHRECHESSFHQSSPAAGAARAAPTVRRAVVRHRSGTEKHAAGAALAFSEEVGHRAGRVDGRAT